MGSSRGSAVVLGAGIAGLLAARVLADDFDQVTVVERDDLGPPGPRKGVPQGRHAHALLTAGRDVLAGLFPRVVEDLIEGGAVDYRLDNGRAWHRRGYRIIPTNVTPPLGVSRPFLEHTIRQRVAQVPRVSFVQATAKALRVDGGRVQAVTVGDDAGREIEADLVVDACGRGSQAPRWLEEHGYPVPPVAEIRIDVSYASRLYTRTPGRLPERSWYLTAPGDDGSGREGGAYPIENDQFIVTLAGFHGDHPPTEESGFVAFAQSLPPGDIGRLLQAEDALGPIRTHRFPSSRWRRYDRIRHHLPGFLAIGDAIASFNPIYGQGMSAAALQAIALRDSVAAVGSTPDLQPAFYRRAAKVIANPWTIAASADFILAGTSGDKPPFTDVFNRYANRAAVAAHRDPVVALALWNVSNLLDPPRSIVTPAMMWRVGRAGHHGPA